MFSVASMTSCSLLIAWLPFCQGRSREEKRSLKKKKKKRLPITIIKAYLLSRSDGEEVFTVVM